MLCSTLLPSTTLAIFVSVLGVPFYGVRREDAAQQVKRYHATPTLVGTHLLDLGGVAFLGAGHFGGVAMVSHTARDGRNRVPVLIQLYDDLYFAVPRGVGLLVGRELRRLAELR